MNKTELVAAIAKKTELSKKDAEKALKAFPALNLGALEAAMCITSPLRGFLPSLAALSDTSKVPNPTNWNLFGRKKDTSFSYILLVIDINTKLLFLHNI